MKKWLFTAAVCLFAVVFTTGCGKKESDVSEPDAQGTPAAVEVRNITYKKLYEANRGSVLLEKYSSVQYEIYSSDGYYDDNGKEVGFDTRWTLFQQDGEVVLMKERMDGAESLVCMDGTCYLESSPDGNEKRHSLGWFMNDSYESYMESCTEEFLLAEESIEDFEEIREEGETYVLLAYVGERDNEKYYYHYTVDKESLEIRSFEASVKEKEGDEWVLSHATVSPGVAVEIPTYVNEMKQAEKERTVTIHTEEKKDIEIKLPKDTTLLPKLEEDFCLFQDKKGEKIFDDTQTQANEDGSYPDAECWLLSARAG